MALKFNVIDLAYDETVDIGYGEDRVQYPVQISTGEMDALKEAVTALKEGGENEASDEVLDIMFKDNLNEIRGSMNEYNFDQLCVTLLADILGKITAERKESLNRVVMRHQKNLKK
jgi:hypothetical protein